METICLQIPACQRKLLKLLKNLLDLVDQQKSNPWSIVVAKSINTFKDYKDD